MFRCWSHACHSRRYPISYALKLDFSTTYNEDEYEALIAGLKIAKELGIKTLHIFCDSQLVVCQVRKEHQAKEVTLAPYLNRVLELLDDFEYYMITHIPREKNRRADSLAKLASFRDTQLMCLVLVLSTSSFEHRPDGCRLDRGN